MSTTIILAVIFIIHFSLSWLAFKWWMKKMDGSFSEKHPVLLAYLLIINLVAGYAILFMLWEIRKENKKITHND